MAKQRPFDTSGWFIINNYIYDVAMPSLSANAFKVLSCAVRQTLGWADSSSPTGRKESDVISYSQFMTRCGIKSRTTISKAIQENLEAGYLVRRQVGQDPRSGKPIFAYSLNTDFEIDDSSPENELPADSSLKNGLPSSPENRLPSSPESGHTKEKKTNKENMDGGGQSIEKSLELLQAAGVTPSMARKLARTCSPADVAGWVSFARSAKGIKNQPALIVARLKAGESPPPADLPDGDPRRYISGKYADLIQH